MEATAVMPTPKQVLDALTYLRGLGYTITSDDGDVFRVAKAGMATMYKTRPEIVEMEQRLRDASRIRLRPDRTPPSGQAGEPDAQASPSPATQQSAPAPKPIQTPLPPPVPADGENKYQVLPELSPEVYEALKADIAQRGVLVPVEYDEYGHILDGTHRVKACRELGIKRWAFIVREGLTEEQKIEHALFLNMGRRQLTPDQKREVALKLRRDRGWTQDRIARMLAVGQATVSRWLSEFIHMDKLSPSQSVTGQDGKSYPVTKQRAPRGEEPVAPAVPADQPPQRPSQDASMARPAPPPPAAVSVAAAAERLAMSTEAVRQWMDSMERAADLALEMSDDALLTVDADARRRLADKLTAAAARIRPTFAN